MPYTKSRLNSLDVLHKFRIEIGEPVELGLIQVHHEELVRRSQISLLRGELTVEVRHVLAMFLKQEPKLSHVDHSL